MDPDPQSVGILFLQTPETCMCLLHRGLSILSYPDRSDSRRVRGECWGHVFPRLSFEETLVMFDHFWDFDRMVEDKAPR
jgi:hypothetical protein